MIYVTIFSSTTEARILKLGVHMYKELLYHRIENRTHCSFSSFHLSIFLSFKGKFVSVFSGNMQATVFKHGILMETE